MPEVFRYTHRVKYSECTVGNHVYYARYLDILEAARGEFFRSLGFPLQKLHEEGFVFPAIECQMRYRGAARYDDVITVEISLSQLRAVRMSFACRILNAAGDLLVEGTTSHACTDPSDQPTRIPKSLADKLAPYLHISPSA